MSHLKAIYLRLSTGVAQVIYGKCLSVMLLRHKTQKDKNKVFECVTYNQKTFKSLVLSF